eukprot:s2836_g15.t1
MHSGQLSARLVLAIPSRDTTPAISSRRTVVAPMASFRPGLARRRRSQGSQDIPAPPAARVIRPNTPTRMLHDAADSGDLDLDIEDDEEELEIRDIEKDLEDPTGTALQKFCRYTRAKLARAERRVLDVGVGALISLNTLVMMLAHQQMGYDAAREIGEYDPGMDSLSISEDSFQQSWSPELAAWRVGGHSGESLGEAKHPGPGPLVSINTGGSPGKWELRSTENSLMLTCFMFRRLALLRLAGTPFDQSSPRWLQVLLSPILVSWQAGKGRLGRKQGAGKRTDFGQVPAETPFLSLGGKTVRDFGAMRWDGHDCIDWFITNDCPVLSWDQQLPVHVRDHVPDVFITIEEAFAVLFLLELCIRLWIHRLQFFRNFFNVFDAFLVALSLVDMLIIKPMAGRVNLVILRILRILKLTRSLRVMRTMRLFSGLRVLVAAVSAFLPSLFWSMLFLTIYMVLGGLLIGNFVMEFINDGGQDIEIRKWIWQHYGTSYRATYTMFQVTFAGCWPSYVNPLYENISHWYSVFFCAYVTFVVFAVMRVITAIFIKETLDAAGEDHEVVMSEKEATKQKYMRKLERVFHEVDTSGDGLISEDEFRGMMEDSCGTMPSLQNAWQFLAGLEVDLNESHSLFHMLADDEGQVSYTKFMEGARGETERASDDLSNELSGQFCPRQAFCTFFKYLERMIRAHGPAKSADVLCIRQDLEFIRKDLKQIKAAAIAEQDREHEGTLGRECGSPSRAASNRSLYARRSVEMTRIFTASANSRGNNQQYRNVARRGNALGSRANG